MIEKNGLQKEAFSFVEESEYVTWVATFSNFGKLWP